jgi:hypothetical protein
LRKYLVLGAVIFAPSVAAQAQSIPNPHLQVSLDRCLQSCSSAHSYGFCAEMCGCITGEIGRYWDMDDFRTRAARLQSNPQDPQVHGEMTRLANYCASRVE